MLLDCITLHNFGVYEGRHEVELSPPNVDRPILLFGGLNGRGKTTMMDAIQLALYGKLAQTSNRGTLAYHDYLEKCIHSSVPKDVGAGIGLSFRYASDGLEHEYRVRRTWQHSGSRLREQVEVVKDGARDRLLEENWAEFVEALLPSRVAQLFFFDGERVEALANPETASDVLSTAIRALLGLDLVDRLTADLQVLERRKRVSGAHQDEREAIKVLETELESTRQQLDSARQERAGVRADLERAAAKLGECNDQLRHEGADIADRRDMVETELATSRDELRHLTHELEAIAYGTLPYALVRPMLERIQTQSGKEVNPEVEALLASALSERNVALLDWLSQRPRSAKLRQEVEVFLNEQKNERQSYETKSYLHLSSAGRSQLNHVLAERLARELYTRDELLQQADRLRACIEELERTLLALPAPDSLAPLLDARAGLGTRLKNLQSQHDHVEQSVEQLVRLEEQQQRRFTARLEAVTLRGLEREDSERLLQFSERARSTLGEFRRRVLESRISALETAILESFSHLLAKEGLVESIRIEPETFALTVHSANGEVLPTDRLSAGERQLLAVSILWGLAKASGRRLPVVIDTPMGRLDSNHRENLLERYFPNASHQVVLLSTDEEIDEPSFRRLEPAIGRAYRLVYSDAAQSTSIQPGYFWEH